MLTLLMVTIATQIQAPSILLVEGTLGRDWALRDLLRTAGYRLFSVGSGEAVAERYAVVRPDLILMEAQVSGIDAIETCRHLQNRHGEACAPILFMSGKAVFGDAPGGFPAGVIGVLPEHLMPEAVLAHIGAYLEGRRWATRQQALLDELRGIIEEKDKQLSMCAHDLRNPLASVCGIAEFLLEPSIGPLNSEQRELVDSIREAGESMLKLVNRLLDLSIVEAGKLKLELVPSSLREFAKRAVFLAAVVGASKGIGIVMQPETSPEPLLMIDVMRIREVVDNLLSNAVKFSPPNTSVRVTIETLPAAAAEQSAVWVRFSVRDQGPGVPEAERDLLFRDFSRLSTCPTAGEKSTGLGLSICRKIIDLHGGTIGAVNHPEGGCVFSFCLPACPSSGEANPAPANGGLNTFAL